MITKIKMKLFLYMNCNRFLTGYIIKNSSIKTTKLLFELL